MTYDVRMWKKSTRENAEIPNYVRWTVAGKEWKGLFQKGADREFPI
jgi:hypothetical protein